MFQNAHSFTNLLQNPLISVISENHISNVKFIDIELPKRRFLEIKCIIRKQPSTYIQSKSELSCRNWNVTRTGQKVGLGRSGMRHRENQFSWQD